MKEQKVVVTITDEDLVLEIQNGSKESFEKLFRKYQPWIYNIVLRMVMLAEDAEDITQEILIKIMTSLSTFKHQSSFKTWLFRIVKNHVMNMKKCKSELEYTSFYLYGKGIDNSPDFDPPDTKNLPVEMNVLQHEIQIHCITGMLLCLNREQRLIFIMGEIVGIGHNIGSKVFDISQANYRKRLSRARKLVYQFMQERCGLVKNKNVCHCKSKLAGMIEAKIINPEYISYKVDPQLQGLAGTKYNKLMNILDKKCRRVFQENSALQSPDFVNEMKKFIYGNELSNLFN
ncbi:RNA polymerase sigma factor [Candidatus Cloacimonadota bacterium]